MNMAETLEVHLNVLGTFDPDLSPTFAETPFLFLANGSPVMQRKVMTQAQKRRLVVADTMNFWIETQRDELYELLSEIDGLVLNDGEARMLTDEINLVRAGWKVLDLGPRFVIIKKGEHGAMFLSRDRVVRDARLPGGRRGRSDRRRRQLRRRLHGLPRVGRQDRPGHAQDRDGVRDGRRQPQRRGLQPPPVPAHRPATRSTAGSKPTGPC